MIPNSILEYLETHDVDFQRRPHLRAITAQALAATLHVTGYRVTKSVILRTGEGELCIAVCAAPDTVDTERAAALMNVGHVRLAEESEFASRFPDCEVGAEPPFGKLYGLPVLLDESLRGAGPLLFRAGSHEEAIEMRFEDFVRLEQPRLGSFIREHRAPMAEEYIAGTMGAQQP